MTRARLLEALEVVRWLQRPSPPPDGADAPLGTLGTREKPPLRVVVEGEVVAMTDTDLRLLGIREPGFFLEIVGQLIRSADHEIRGAVYLHLGEFDDDRAEGLILDALTHEPDVNAQSWAILSLMRHGTKAALPALLQLAADDRVDWAEHRISDLARDAIEHIEARARHAQASF